MKNLDYRLSSSQIIGMKKIFFAIMNLLFLLTILGEGGGISYEVYQSYQWELNIRELTSLFYYYILIIFVR